MAGVVSALTLLILVFLTAIPLWLSVILSGAVYVGTLWSIPSDSPLDEVAQIIRKGREVVKEIQKLGLNVSRREVQEKLNHICKTAEKIFKAIQKNPHEATEVKAFLKSYLGTTKDIMKRYIELSSQGIRERSVTETLSNVEDALDKIRASFEEQLVQLAQDEAYHLDVDVEVIKAKLEFDKVREYKE